MPQPIRQSSRMDSTVSSQVAAAIKATIDSRDVSKRQAIERLIEIGKYVLDAQDAGDTVLIRRRRGGATEVVHFPF